MVEFTTGKNVTSHIALFADNAVTELMFKHIMRR
jgi:hypothetical protein